MGVSKLSFLSDPLCVLRIGVIRYPVAVPYDVLLAGDAVAGSITFPSWLWNYGAAFPATFQGELGEMHMDRSGISNSLKTMTMERTLKWEAQPACHQHCLGSFCYWSQDRAWEQDQRSRRRRRTRLAQPKAGFGRAQCVTIVDSQKRILESDK